MSQGEALELQSLAPWFARHGDRLNANVFSSPSTVVFRSLTVDENTEIVDLMLARVREHLRAQQMLLEVTTAAKEHIIKLGYDVAYGARPLRRVIQNMIEDVLAEHLLLGKYEPGTTIVVDRDPEAGLDIHAAEPLTPVEA